ATLLAEEGTTILSNVPTLSDTYMMNEVIRHLNAEVDFDENEHQVTINATKTLHIEAPYEYVSQMRASIVVMGPLLARNGHAKVSMPGGCTIGARPIDLHLKGFEALGAQISQDNGYIEAKASELRGARIYLDFPSVGATQNIMMAATLAKGTTVLENVAREPEIVDLANVLNKMGAKVFGAGTETIRIEGVEHLHATQHNVVQDRIEAGTFMVAAAMTGGNVLIKDAIIEHNRPLISKLQEMGVVITEESVGIRVKGPKKLKATNVKTMPHPGFPTDMQAQMSVALAHANGVSTMTETVFENRFQHLEEMRRMNLDVTIEGAVALINGGKQLQGATVAATDLRAAAALVLTGLVSQGVTRVTNLKYLDRGYHRFHEKLQDLGANVERVEVEENKLVKSIN
ncbi:MAG: UDP-N-acetylglucosamine 1-carboxyvinyltransferase, partial [Streptococcaceae bacterium]|nr:UDP-N-acetylglucosamine 1-carboxyvinyltransferase [Streptococcaceae bacterium]